MGILNQNNEVIHIVETSGLEKTKLQRLLEMFTPCIILAALAFVIVMYRRAKEPEIVVVDENPYKEL